MSQKSKTTEGEVVASRRSDATFRQILALIYDGQLAPGERLPPERELAGLFDVSRPTIRDALNRLEARGFVDRRTGSGNYVCSSLPESIRSPMEEGVREKLVTLQQIIDVRKPMEIWAAGEAARCCNREQLASLRRTLDAMSRSGAGRKTKSSEEAYFQADIRFHMIIAQMTGNPVYVHLIRFLTDLIRTSLSISQEIIDNAFSEENTERHRAVYESIAAGDSATAAQAMAEHFEFVELHLSSE